uniref:ribosomal protein S3 n=1 Tax=Cyathus jiayuguanensis TaxID=380660 RepID=UPI0023F2B8B9|nr:ribosomal protein S3 [Cyathus jiayuguanensis]WDS46475.1 ribosomal protein S3 [Cyathus jiayuguanensis]
MFNQSFNNTNTINDNNTNTYTNTNPIKINNTNPLNITNNNNNNNTNLIIDSNHRSVSSLTENLINFVARIKLKGKYAPQNSGYVNLSEVDLQNLKIGFKQIRALRLENEVALLKKNDIFYYLYVDKIDADTDEKVIYKLAAIKKKLKSTSPLAKKRKRLRLFRLLKKQKRSLKKQWKKSFRRRQVEMRPLRYKITYNFKYRYISRFKKSISRINRIRSAFRKYTNLSLRVKKILRGNSTHQSLRVNPILRRNYSHQSLRVNKILRRRFRCIVRKNANILPRLKQKSNYLTPILNNTLTLQYYAPAVQNPGINLFKPIFNWLSTTQVNRTNFEKENHLFNYLPLKKIVNTNQKFTKEDKTLLINKLFTSIKVKVAEIRTKKKSLTKSNTNKYTTKVWTKNTALHTANKNWTGSRTEGSNLGIISDFKNKINGNNLGNSLSSRLAARLGDRREYHVNSGVIPTPKNWIRPENLNNKGNLPISPIDRRENVKYIPWKSNKGIFYKSKYKIRPSRPEAQETIKYYGLNWLILKNKYSNLDIIRKIKLLNSKFLSVSKPSTYTYTNINKKKDTINPTLVNNYNKFTSSANILNNTNNNKTKIINKTNTKTKTNTNTNTNKKALYHETVVYNNNINNNNKTIVKTNASPNKNSVLLNKTNKIKKNNQSLNKTNKFKFNNPALNNTNKFKNNNQALALNNTNKFKKNNQALNKINKINKINNQALALHKTNKIKFNNQALNKTNKFKINSQALFKTFTNTISKTNNIKIKNNTFKKLPLLVNKFKFNNKPITKTYKNNWFNELFGAYKGIDKLVNINLKLELNSYSPINRSITNRPYTNINNTITNTQTSTTSTIPKNDWTKLAIKIKNNKNLRKISTELLNYLNTFKLEQFRISEYLNYLNKKKLENLEMAEKKKKGTLMPSDYTNKLISKFNPKIHITNNNYHDKINEIVTEIRSSKLEPHKRGVSFFYNKIITYNFNKFSNAGGYTPEKFFINIEKLLKAFFKSIYCLISKPVFIITPDKVTIQLFYFIALPKVKIIRYLSKIAGIQSINNNNALKLEAKKINRRLKIKQKIAILIGLHKSRLIIRNNQLKLKIRKLRFYQKIRLKKILRKITKQNKSQFFLGKIIQAYRFNIAKAFPDKFRMFTDILSKLFNKPVEFDLIRLHKATLDSTILVTLIGLIINKKRRYKHIINRLYRKVRVVRFKFKKISKVKARSRALSFLTGLNIKLSGRLRGEKVIPKKTTKEKIRGISAPGKVNFLDVATLTRTNKKGAFTIKVTSGQNLF